MENTTDPTGGASPTQKRSLPSLPARLVAVFFSPGKLMEQLAAEPRWVGVLLVGAIAAGLSAALIPIDLIVEANRQQMLELGIEYSERSEDVIRSLRMVLPIATVPATMFMVFLFAGVCTLIFAFILGDEGTYKRYLAVVSHGWFIAILLNLMVTPLRISTGDLQFRLSLGSFMFFLQDGYLLNVFRAMDLTQIWSTLVIAQGCHAIDTRRSFTSAATILMVLLLAWALVLARLM